METIGEEPKEKREINTGMSGRKWIYHREERLRNVVRGAMEKKTKSEEEIEEFERTVKHTEMPEKIRMGEREEYLNWQTRQEEARKAELDKKGIKGEEYLTREALKRWIEDEKRSYMEVARDYVGLNREIVTMYAKEYGVESENSKKAKERMREREEAKRKEEEEKKIRITRITEYE